MDASIAIQILPNVEGDKQVCKIVDDVIGYIKSTGLSCYVGPFETTVEGKLEELIDIIKECQYVTIKSGAPSLMSYVKIHFNPKGGVLTINEKVTKHHK